MEQGKGQYVEKDEEEAIEEEEAINEEAPTDKGHQEGLIRNQR